jgi:hypothetical protein
VTVRLTWQSSAFDSPSIAATVRSKCSISRRASSRTCRPSSVRRDFRAVSKTGTPTCSLNRFSIIDTAYGARPSTLAASASNPCHDSYKVAKRFDLYRHPDCNFRLAEFFQEKSHQTEVLTLTHTPNNARGGQREKRLNRGDNPPVPGCAIRR